jgi:hypothetical protein
VETSWICSEVTGLDWVFDGGIGLVPKAISTSLDGSLFIYNSRGCEFVNVSVPLARALRSTPKVAANGFVRKCCRLGNKTHN